MFSRSRRKIILSIMISLVLLFSVTLSVIALASYREIRRQNIQMLEQFADQYSPDQPQEWMKDPVPAPDSEKPDRVPDHGAPFFGQRLNFRLSNFYSVALSEDGSLLAVDNGERDIYDEETLIQTARELLSGSRQTGKTGSLTYLIRQKGDYVLVAFLDSTISEGSMKLLIHNILLIGGAAMIVLFGLSLFLSKQIIKPLEENDQKQKQFISDASHELKTPVAVIHANAELLSGELGENEWLSNILYENERMGELVKQLLDLSRAENAETPMEPLDFSRTVTGEVLAFESLAFDQGKTIRSEIEEGIRINGSQTQLTQLVSVLLDNALQHAGGNEIAVELKQQGHAAVLSVTNEGAEIPPEKLAHLFDRFYRIDEARSGDSHHYGLGLSIAKAVTEKHGGSIDVSCRDGLVCFSVSLPAKK